MAPHGTIVPLTISFDDLKLPMMPLVLKELNIKGSCSSTLTQVNAMLKFCVLHNIRPWVEEFPGTLGGINEALKKLENGKIRYRGVVTFEDDDEKTPKTWSNGTNELGPMPP